MIATHIRPGLRVRTKDVQTKAGILAGPKFLANRKDGVVGEVTGAVANHEGVWWVRDEATREHAPYWFHELDLLPPNPADDWRDGVPR